MKHARARAARRRNLLAVLFLDLDNFKTVNDSLGHIAGDELLVEVARRLSANLRAGDTAARLGGDEFAVLIEDLSCKAEAIEVAQRVMAAVRQPVRLAGRQVIVSVSVGIAYQDSDLNGDQLLRNADLAMYRAKTMGKGRAEVFEPGMHTAALERLDLESDLRRALDHGELTVQYQPIVSLRSGQVSSVEALVRWHHPERGLLSPATFIPLAEETGLIQELGRQVLFEACARARGWGFGHPGEPSRAISVNISPEQLGRDDLIGHVSAALDGSGLGPSSLVLEITEGAMMRDTEANIAKLAALKALGAKLAIDDFGTGYSSLSYIQRFPVDIVKIDRSFVATMDTGEDKASLPRAIISLAQALRLDVVAEGVETVTQLRLLEGLGCDFAQGYLLGRPMDGDAMEDVLRREGSDLRTALTSPCS